jgi:hypothetical protein
MEIKDIAGRDLILISHRSDATCDEGSGDREDASRAMRIDGLPAYWGSERRWSGGKKANQPVARRGVKFEAISAGAAICIRIV